MIAIGREQALPGFAAVFQRLTFPGRWVGGGSEDTRIIEMGVGIALTGLAQTDPVS